MSDYKLSIILIVLFVGYVIFRPVPKFAVNTVIPPGGQTAPAVGQCVSHAELEEMKQKCTPENAKADLAKLKERVDAMENQVVQGFNGLAGDWQKAQEHRKDDRDLIVQRLKTEVMTSCPGVR